MSLAGRLVLGSTAVVASVMLMSAVVTLKQRNDLISEAIARETDSLAQAVEVVANSAIRNDRVDNLDRILHRILLNPDLAVGAVVDSSGRMIAGAATDATCMAPLIQRASRTGGLQGWARCGERVRVAVRPLERPGAWLFIARRATTLERDQAMSVAQIALTTLALVTLASLAIVGVLRIGLSRPLSSILAGVRQLGGPSVPRPIVVPRSARELEELGTAFNEMVERLEGKRLELLQEANERVELEQRLRRAEIFAAIGRLSAGLAHELGSPLGVIRMRAEAIGVRPDDLEAVREHVGEIEAEVDRIAKLVRDLLHVSRTHGMTATPLDLRAVAASIGESASVDAVGAGVALETRLPDEPVTVAGDLVLLRHAAMNLVTNALQAIHHSGRGTRVRISVGHLHSRGTLSVEDDGPGIPMEEIDTVTQPFYTTKDVGEGSGLGLAITTGIVEEHGGTLYLDRAPAGGLRARIELPLLEPGGGEP